jgi:Cu(I)/Ag(I) efflux system membrane protein CusA/SilA
MMQPLALTVVGGLTVSTLLTLIVIPCTYLVVHHAADRLKAWVIGGAPEPVETPAD